MNHGASRLALHVAKGSKLFAHNVYLKQPPIAEARVPALQLSTVRRELVQYFRSVFGLGVPAANGLVVSALRQQVTSAQ